ncbi:MAG TPA: hypothetical protein VFL90_09365 [Methylomirabilota bacterium]|nr:hypothetical protein [Methylomirabilota bacterium]
MRVLHLLKGADAGLALETIAQQRAAGDIVTLALLPGAALAPPAGVTVRRVPGELSWDGLLEEIFQADQVITW